MKEREIIMGFRQTLIKEIHAGNSCSLKKEIEKWEEWKHERDVCVPS